MAMATSLYDLSVASYLQTVGAVAGFMERAAKHCAETGVDPDDFVGVQLFDDMAPFHFQIRSVAHHSVGAPGESMCGPAAIWLRVLATCQMPSVVTH